MTLHAMAISSGPVVTESGGGGFAPPSPDDFWQPLWTPFGDALAITRPMLVATVVAVVLLTWLLLATRRVGVVPSRGQYSVEMVYGFIREDIGRGMIGNRHFRRFMPLLFTLFTFIYLNNLAGIVPPLLNPAAARISFPLALVLVVYLTYHWVGIQKHGFGGYFKHMVPPGLPVFMVPIIFLLEAMTYFITRPLTLTLRLFGNMFAGHMLLVLFILGGEFLLFEAHGNPAVMIGSGIGSFLMAVLMTVFEMLVQFLQAYVFTLLAASYIGGSLAEDH